MNAGAILSPFAQAAGPGVVGLLQGWGPGRFDVRALPDNPLDDGVDNPTKVPPLWNFVDLSEQGYLYNWDGLFKNGPAANALASQAEAVYDLVMHANGAFGTAGGTLAPELSATPPQAVLDALAAAEAARPGNDLTLQKLLDVQAWQRSLVSPAPGAFDATLAERGPAFHGRPAAPAAAAPSSPARWRRHASARSPQGGLAGGIKTPGLRGVAGTTVLPMAAHAACARCWTPAPDA